MVRSHDPALKEVAFAFQGIRADMHGQRRTRTAPSIVAPQPKTSSGSMDPFGGRGNTGAVSEGYFGRPNDLANALVQGASYLLGMAPPPDTEVIPRPPVREVVDDQCGEATAIVQRKIYENFLIRDDRVFVRGGDPVFVKNHHFRKRTWEIVIASVGADRSVNPFRSGIGHPPGVFDYWSMQDSFRKGHFWSADQRDLARAAAHPMQKEISTIEVFGEPLVDRTLDVIVDALFREAFPRLPP